MRSPFVAAATVSPLALLALLALLGACGPSYRTVVEGDMRFEHCYTIDEDGRTSVEQKRTCWRSWTARYTRGQDPARVKYAKDRIEVLDGVAAPTAPTSSPESWAAGPSGPSGTVIASPSPTTPYAPPPSLAPGNGTGNAKASGEVAGMAVPPGKWQGCAEGCGKGHRACMDGCAGKATCPPACDEAYRTCMKGCF
jgi:hypothetical protein